MARCRECNAKVWRNAEYCPQCGVRYPAKGYPSTADPGQPRFRVSTLVGVVVLGIILFALFRSGGGGGSGGSVQPMDASSPTDVRNAAIAAQPTEVVRFTADSLFNAYDSNEVATDISLKGKIVEVTGRVQSINKNVFDQMYVSLATQNQFEPAQMNVVPADEPQIAALRKGQVVVFRCPKMKRWVGSPTGDDCVLINAN